MKIHVLDANALYRFLTGGPGADLVSRLFRQARDAGQPLRMSVINWGEVYYTISRSQGASVTDKILDHAKLLPLSIIDADEALTIQAARYKAGYGLPYADCFAAAVAGTSGVLVTSDAKDFKKLPALNILALPPHKSH